MKFLPFLFSIFAAEANEESDEALLQKISEQNVDAFSHFYDRHATAVYQVILRIIREQNAADELLQETFWSIWQKADQYQQRGSAIAWLMRIARNNCFDELRKRKSRPQAAQLSETEHQAILSAKTDKTVQIEDQLVNRWMQQKLHHSLNRLPHEQQECLKLAYFDGLSQSKIAKQLSIPLGTVKTRMRLGVQKLELFLHEEVSTQTDLEQNE